MSDEYEIVTEVGAFDGMDIDDPTVKKVKKKKLSDEEINELLKENNKLKEGK